MRSRIPASLLLEVPRWAPKSYTLIPTPYTLHPAPYTLHPTPYTLHPTPYTLHLEYAGFVPLDSDANKIIS